MTTHFMNKKPLIIATSIVIVLAIGIATALLLMISSKNSETTVITPLRAQEVIQTYDRLYTDSNLRVGYLGQKSSMKNGSIEYTSGEKPYNIQLPAAHSLTYNQSATAKNGSIATLTTEAEAFLVSQGLAKGSSVATTSSSRVLYVGPLSTCQVTSFQAITNSSVANIPAAFGIGCTDTKNITDEYASIEALLALYKKSNDSATISHINRATVEHDQTPITILYISTGDTKLRAYFVTLDKTPTFIGTQSVPVADGDQVIKQSVAFTTALANPIYGTFLAQTIEKY